VDAILIFECSVGTFVLCALVAVLWEDAAKGLRRRSRRTRAS
jgi:hypothetical protein